MRFGVQTEDGIAQRDDKGRVAREMFTRENSIAEAFGRHLTSIEKLGARTLFVRLDIEVIFDRRFVAASDEQNLLNTVGRKLVNHIFDDRFTRHREHFLGLGTSGWEQ